MIVAPFAGNLLALDSIYQKWLNIDFLQKNVLDSQTKCNRTSFCCLPFHLGYPPLLSTDNPSSNDFLMLLGILDYCKEHVLHLCWPIGTMYLSQSPDPSRLPSISWAKASLVDMVSTDRFTPRQLKLSSSNHGTQCIVASLPTINKINRSTSRERLGVLASSTPSSIPS